MDINFQKINLYFEGVRHLSRCPERGVPPHNNVVNCMTRVRRVRRLMNTVWRLVRTFWPKKKCHHIRTFCKSSYY